MRFGNVYGPRQGAVGEAGVVAIFCRELIQGGSPVLFGDGTQTRDFVYVGDVVAAMLAASDRGALGEFNVGTGKETSVLDLVDQLATIGGRADFIPEQMPARAGEIDRMALDATRLRTSLGEGYVALYRELHGLPAASLRFGNVYGPRQGAVGEAGVVAIFCRELIQGGSPLLFGDGTQTRDFVYVGDVVAAMLAASDRGALGEFNVGTGKETSVLDLIDQLATIGGRADFIPEQMPARAGEIDRMALDATRLRSSLGWVDRTPIEIGLRLTWESSVRRRYDPDRQSLGGPQGSDPASRTLS